MLKLFITLVLSSLLFFGFSFSIGRRDLSFLQRKQIFKVKAESDQRPTAIGSDALHRPDDEDSPEFREYLKKLLEMQMTRAKSGFSAPSSSSSAVYIAKLNRIKLERRMRKKLGLPEEEVSTSYREEDYQLAR